MASGHVLPKPTANDITEDRNYLTLSLPGLVPAFDDDEPDSGYYKHKGENDQQLHGTRDETDKGDQIL